jgi:hypothetical protein
LQLEFAGTGLGWSFRSLVYLISQIHPPVKTYKQLIYPINFSPAITKQASLLFALRALLV